MRREHPHVGYNPTPCLRLLPRWNAPGVRGKGRGMPKPLHYTVAVPDPASHQFHLTLAVPEAPPRIRLMMPRWTPGSYLLREHGRHVTDVTATVAGQPAVVEKVDPHVFEVRSDGEGDLEVSYKVYGHELAVRTAHLDDTHGFFNGVNVFLLPEGLASRPCRLTLQPPPGWPVATTLPAHPDGGYAAEDYHHLVDCPVEMGTHQSFAFEVRGVPHQFVVWNKGNLDLDRLKADLPRLVETNAQVFGELPYPRYLFITHLTDTGRGGLEHRDSTALLYPRFGFRKEKDYQDFLALCAHEHFHAWNVKRIQPKVFAPYDYSQENPTRLLWALEGFTAYYDNRCVLRSALMPNERYLALLGELITTLHNTPGRHTQTLEDASMEAWVKLYRPDANSANSTVSYYLKGELAALCLDLSIRHHSGGERSLDDVMAQLWAWTKKRGQGLEDSAWEEALVGAGGPQTRALLRTLVGTTQELPLPECLAYVGLELNWRASEGADDKGGTSGKEPSDDASTAWLGASVRKDGTLNSTRADGPAARAGLAPGDVLVAWGGFKAAEGGWSARLAECAPGQQVAVHFFRRDELRHTTVVLGTAPQSTAFITRRETPPPQVAALRDAWLGQG